MVGFMSLAQTIRVTFKVGAEMVLTFSSGIIVHALGTKCDTVIPCWNSVVLLKERLVDFYNPMYP